jgi:hypothetical protein
MALKLQAEQVMAGIVSALDRAVTAVPQHLTTACRAVFTEAPEEMEWCDSPVATGCWVAECKNDIFTLNLLTGAAMCNGHSPSHLPDAIIGHEVYQKVFQNVVFDVTPKVDGDVVTYRTSHAINGCTYTWRKNGDRLIVTENCGDETLELLPCAFCILDVFYCQQSLCLSQCTAQCCRAWMMPRSCVLELVMRVLHNHPCILGVSGWLLCSGSCLVQEAAHQGGRGQGCMALQEQRCYPPETDPLLTEKRPLCVCFSVPCGEIQGTG